MRVALLPLAALLACGARPATDAPADDTASPDTAADDTGPSGDTDPRETDTVDTDPPRPTPRCTASPPVGLTHVCDLSVNDASATTAAASGSPLVLDVLQSSFPAEPGGYNGQGRGNRAIAGLHGYDGARLADLGAIVVDAQKATGALPLELYLQVDLGCDRDRLVLLTVGDDWPPPTDLGGSKLRYTARADAAMWSSGAGDLPEPDAPVGTPPVLWDVDDSAGSPRTLGRLLDLWPDACLRNADSGFGELPRSPAVASALLLTTGSAVTWNLRAQWRVWRWAVGADVHAPPE